MYVRDLAVDVIEDDALTLKGGKSERAPGGLQNACSKGIIERLRRRVIAAGTILVSDCRSRCCRIAWNHGCVLSEALRRAKRCFGQEEQTIAATEDGVFVDPVDRADSRLNVAVLSIEGARRLSACTREQKATLQ